MDEKSVKLSESFHNRHLKLVKSQPAFEHEALPCDLSFGVDPHHLRGVFRDRRRSNPILVPLQRCAHDFLHDHPEVEDRLRPELLLEALRLLCLHDPELMEIAVRSVLTEMYVREMSGASL